MMQKSHLDAPALNRLVLDHIIHGIVTGDHGLASQLGITAAMARQLTELRTGEINRLANLRGCIRIAVDVPALARLLDHLEQERRKEHQVHELIRRGAPSPMLLSLFDMNGREITALRYAMGLPGSPGRTRQPTEEEEREIWEAMRRLELDPWEMQPPDWIELHDATGVPLRTLWSSISEWRSQQPRRLTV